MSDAIKHSIRWSEGLCSEKLSKTLSTLGTEYPISKDSGDIEVEFVSGPEGECSIKLSGNKATITYGSDQLAVRALSTLMSGLVEDGKEYVEKSPFTTFGIMLDCSRNGVMKVEHFKGWLRKLALLGYNMAMLYTEDTYELDGEPFFGYQRGGYTADELREIDAYADSLGIEMIPCVQTLAHMEQILRWPEYGKIRDTPAVMMVGEEETYRLVEKIIAHWKNVFRTDRIHIGMDEAHGLGLGQYLRSNGYKKGFDLMNEHLNKVMDIVSKYDLKPMIWSDMYFRLGSLTDQYYDRECVIPKEVAEKIPAGMELVYWDYYHKDKDFYCDWIDRHRNDLNSEPLVGSGIWTWSRLWHDFKQSESTAGPCIEACREKNVKEIFFTMWGDDGAYCDFDSAFAGLAYAAEKAYADTSCTNQTGARFAAVCGSDFTAHLTASEMHKDSQEDAVNEKVSAESLLWDDPLLGIYYRGHEQLKPGIFAETEKHFAELAEKLKPFSSDKACGDLNHARLLLTYLGQKAGFLRRLNSAWKASDKEALKAAVAETETLRSTLSELSESFRANWFNRNKPFGYEVIQSRLATMDCRLAETARRLEEYLNGKAITIPELDSSVPEHKVFLGGAYRTTMSGSVRN